MKSKLLTAVIITAIAFSTKGFSQYCTPTIGTPCTSTYYISKVTVGTINNTSTCNGNPNNYINYPTSSFTTTLIAGNTYSITVNGFSSAGALGGWIDYNQNGSFADTGEFIFSVSGNNSYSGNIVIPASAIIGQTRMRIMRTGGGMGPNAYCSTFGSGECEDYTITIQSSSSSSCTPLITSGLVGYYPFCGNANDVSGSGNNGTLNGPTLVADRFAVANRAYSFNGTTDSITVPNSASLQFGSNLQTVSFWMKVPQMPTPISEEAIFEKMDQHLSTDASGNSAQGFKIAFAPNSNIDYAIKSGSSSSWGTAVITSSKYLANQYYNIVFTDDNDSLRGYVNGSKVVASKIPSGTVIGTNTSPFLMGKERWSNSTQSLYNGILDDIAVYSRALSACEITQLYNGSLIKDSISGTTTICSGNTTTLTATGGGNYLWNTAATTNSIAVAPTTGTGYTVTATYASGCTAVASTSVTVNTTPTVTISGNTTITSGNNTTLTASGGSTYSWSTGSSSSSIVVSPVINKVYTVTVTNSSGCTAVATVSVTVTNSTSINEVNNEINISIFPNPASENLNINFISTQDEKIIVQVVNMLGQVVKTIDFGTIPSGNNTKTIGIIGISKGFYSLKISGRDFQRNLPVIME